MLSRLITVMADCILVCQVDEEKLIFHIPPLTKFEKQIVSCPKNRRDGFPPMTKVDLLCCNYGAFIMPAD